MLYYNIKIVKPKNFSDVKNLDYIPRMIFSIFLIDVTYQIIIYCTKRQLSLVGDGY